MNMNSGLTIVVLYCLRGITIALRRVIRTGARMPSNDQRLFADLISHESAARVAATTDSHYAQQKARVFIVRGIVEQKAKAERPPKCPLVTVP